MSKKTILTFFLLLNFFLISTVFGQTVGDYRSSANGNWITPGSWQICTSVSPITWTTATNYPGQIAGTGAVLIQTGHTISISATLTTLSFGTLTITGTLNLNGDNSAGGMDFNLATQSIIVTPSPGGFIGFSQKVNLRLPSTASLQVTTGGLDNSNPCTANQIIYIGSNAYAKCVGGGALPDFADLMTSGGTLSANPTSNPTSPVCQFNSINLIGNYKGVAGTTTSGGTISGVNYSWSVIAPDASNITVNTKDYSFTANQTGTYKATLSCSTFFGTTPFTNSKTITVIVNVLPSTPTIGTMTQPTCSVLTGSVVLSGLPASGTWTLYQNGSTIHTATGGTGTYTVSGLAAGTYNFAVSNGTCTSGASSDVVINPTTNTWNGISWSNGIPISTQVITFNGSYTSTSDLTACSCTVNSGAVKINSGKNLILEGKLTVNAPGTLTFEDSASLVQTTAFTGLNSGNIIYKRNISSALTTDYTYWSSPVASQTLNLSPYYVSGMFYSFNNSTEAWIPATISTPMVVGQGYIARGPVTTLPPGFYNATFTGEPNNGNQTITVAGGAKSILLGNPYPSAIDADTFILANSSAIDGTLYFWTHNTPIAIGTPNPGSGVWAYSGNDYASYTLSGGTGTAGNFNDTNGNGTMDLGEEVVSNKPTGKIAAGQGFFTTSSSAGGTVNFTNVMRLGNPNDNSNFYKTKNTKIKTTAKLEKHRVWLNLTNKEGAFKQTLVGYITGATNNWDSLFDGLSFDANDFLDFYSINQEKNLTIQGRALPFDENDEIPLGYRIAVEGTFSISIDETDGMLANQDIFIEDKLTNTVFDLKSGKYTFNTTAGTFDDRFVLRYTNKTLGKEEVELNDGIIALYSNNYKTLIIRNNVNDATVNAVELFNLLGQNITNWEVDDSEQINIQIPIKNTSSGIYIVKIKTTKGEFSKKIIIK